MLRRHKNKQLAVIILLIFLLAAVFASVILVREQQRFEKQAASTSVTLSLQPSTNTFNIGQITTYNLFATFQNGSATEQVGYFQTKIIFPKDYIEVDSSLDAIDTTPTGLGQVLRVDLPSTANETGQIIIRRGILTPTDPRPPTNQAMLMARIKFKGKQAVSTQQLISTDRSYTVVFNSDAPDAVQIPVNDPTNAQFTVNPLAPTNTPTVTPTTIQPTNTPTPSPTTIAPTNTPTRTPTPTPTTVVGPTNTPTPSPTPNPNLVKVGTIYFKAKTGVSGSATVDFKTTPQSRVSEQTTAVDILGQTTGLTFTIGGGITPPAGTPIISFNFQFRDIVRDIGQQTIIVRVKKGTFFKEFTNITSVHTANGIYNALNVPLLGVSPGSDYEIFVKGPKHLAKGFKNITLVANNNSLFDFTTSGLEPGDLPPQDGVINSQDISRLIELLDVPSPTAADLNTADLNYDGVINGGDVNELILTLSIKYDEDVY